ncbi:hypothetical protein Aau02nite_14420 [Amorphoplanes auranticolor]|uniref:Uncharacterized protein n=1 Tax=Actinoplanes auranticolor TaxID=47988 RepID=A0A919S4U7_9ACTN|nr:hypothetical protein Aau02nite_14420 [Actinoplanes auranticolor]
MDPAAGPPRSRLSPLSAGSRSADRARGGQLGGRGLPVASNDAAHRADGHERARKTIVVLKVVPSAWIA